MPPQLLVLAKMLQVLSLALPKEMPLPPPLILKLWQLANVFLSPDVLLRRALSLLLLKRMPKSLPPSPPKRTPWLPLLLLVPPALLATPGEAVGTMYVPHSVAHASRPLRVGSGAVTQCAVECGRTGGCVKWSHRPATGLCHLWPLHSPENPLTATPEPVHQTLLPEGFTLSDDPTIAYRKRDFELVGGNDSIIDSCKAYDPEAFPAFPHTQQQIDYLKPLVSSGMFWIGIWDENADNVFRDMTTGRVVELQNAWFFQELKIPSSGVDCLAMVNGGLYFHPCSSSGFGHICEYHITKTDTSSSDSAVTTLIIT